LSTHRSLDGLWIGTYEPEAEAALLRVEEALRLIKTYDRLRYDRVIRDVKRVWVRTLVACLAQFNESVDACELDARYVLATTSSPAEIASTIVHEATHARLLHCRIGYAEELRARVEAVCSRRELAFARRLPDGAEVTEMRKRAERRLELMAEDKWWTNETFNERYEEDVTSVARFVGVPIWVARAALAVRKLNLAVRGQLRRIFRL